MTKLDFSDLYKFIVSIGTILLALALIIPWLFLRESFDILVTLAEFNELTPAAQQLFTRRQEAAWWVTTNIGYISGILFLIGISFVVYGSYLWRQRQLILDQKEALEKQKLEHEIKSMTPMEVTHKAVQKLEAVQTDEFELDASLTEMAVANYLNIKARISQKIGTSFQITHKLLVDQKLEGQDVDIFLSGKNNDYPDGIIEVRYTSQPIRISWLRETASNAMTAALTYKKTIPRSVKAIVLITAQKNILEKSDTAKLLSQIESEIAFDAPRIKFLSTEEVESLEKDEWRNIVFPDFEPKEAQTNRLNSSFSTKARLILEEYAQYLIGLGTIVVIGLACISTYLAIPPIRGSQFWWVVIGLFVIIGVSLLIRQWLLLRNPLPRGNLVLYNEDGPVTRFPIPRRSRHKITERELKQYPNLNLKEIKLQSVRNAHSENRNKPIIILLEYKSGARVEFFTLGSGQRIPISNGIFGSFEMDPFDFIDDLASFYDTPSGYR